jgi:hypothetical protein
MCLPLAMIGLKDYSHGAKQQSLIIAYNQTLHVYKDILEAGNVFFIRRLKLSEVFAHHDRVRVVMYSATPVISWWSV